ncbi:hypothetical protein M3I53_18800 [Paraburkholderia sp. CNPSo 3272]|uniref:DUF4148 domain-containing protein n=1 Tax=Paraburkholderia sp. CNPSo 3272 TaxID=2940931 RepID=UPI0020B6DE5E|nr:DUF4148 domain-containing protein [Paraburkholderia sp. CNPSo 3272]MCP3725150.1 hypothetical protein [Paraburkholderia sp. CNPSo 3272]
MKKLTRSTMPVVIALAALFSAAGAHAQTVQDSQTHAAAPTQHALTRRDVERQLVKAEQDGSLASADSIYYGTYWGWENPVETRSLVSVQ